MGNNVRPVPLSTPLFRKSSLTQVTLPPTPYSLSCFTAILTSRFILDLHEASRVSLPRDDTACTQFSMPVFRQRTTERGSVYGMVLTGPLELGKEAHGSQLRSSDGESAEEVVTARGPARHSEEEGTTEEM